MAHTKGPDERKGFARIDWHKMYVKENKLNTELLEALKELMDVVTGGGSKKEVLIKAKAAIQKTEKGEGR